MFTEMRVRNFKSWEDSGPIGLAPVTGFFGTNSSGKTSLLQALLLLKQTAESVDRRQVLNLGDDRSHMQLGVMTDIIYNHDEDSRLNFDFSWCDPQLAKDLRRDLPESELRSEVGFSFGTEIGLDRKNGPYVEESSYTAENIRVRYYRSVANQKYDILVSIQGNDEYLQRHRGRPPSGFPPPIRYYGFPDKFFARFQNADFLSYFPESLERLFDRLYYLGPVRQRPQRLYEWQGSVPSGVGISGGRAIEALLASHQLPKIARHPDRRGRVVRNYPIRSVVRHWLRELQLAESFDLEPMVPDVGRYRVMIKPASDAAEVLLPDIGFGISQVLPVLVLLACVPEGSIVILEQPELHLHPSVQSGLADIILETARVRRAQVIVESHSEHLLMRIQRRIAEEKYAKDDVAMYFCSHTGGRSRIERLELDEYGRIANWPRGFFGDLMGEAGAMVDAGVRRSQRR